MLLASLGEKLPTRPAAAGAAPAAAAGGSPASAAAGASCAVLAAGETAAYAGVGGWRAGLPKALAAAPPLVGMLQSTPRPAA